MTVLRWHSNPDPRLRNSGDTIDTHQRRVCAMCQDLAARHGLPLEWSDLPRAALKHDEAERVMGDWPGPLTDMFPWLAPIKAMLERIILRRMGIAPFNLSEEEWAILKICDKLDAILWAKLCGAADAAEWHDAFALIKVKAFALSPAALAWVLDAYEDYGRWIGRDRVAVEKIA